MKLPLLLTQFLYQHKKLNLPGIGSFTLDPSVVFPENFDKNQHEIIHGIEYVYTPITKADDDLIDFIRLYTGKMKSLAVADLDSYLTLGIQLLNIGKPFYFDGIGAISKTQEGRYEFTPGEYISFTKSDDSAEKKDKSEKRKPIFEEQHDEYGPQSNATRKILLTIAILGGLALIGWGGYVLYKKNTYPSENTNPPIKLNQDTSTSRTDSNSLGSGRDSSHENPPENHSNANLGGDSTLYKFIILATDRKYRALRRYDQLLSYQLKIKMETKDSSFFKLYFLFPAVPKDTTAIKDSLDRVYATKSFIEKQR